MCRGRWVATAFRNSQNACPPVAQLLHQGLTVDHRSDGASKELKLKNTSAHTSGKRICCAASGRHPQHSPRRCEATCSPVCELAMQPCLQPCLRWCNLSNKMVLGERICLIAAASGRTTGVDQIGPTPRGMHPLPTACNTLCPLPAAH
jgi:hypothetical protein